MSSALSACDALHEKVMNIPLKVMNIPLKVMNIPLQIMNIALKVMNIALKMPYLGAKGSESDLPDIIKVTLY